jgi:hypothetical protein
MYPTINLKCGHSIHAQPARIHIAIPTPSQQNQRLLVFWQGPLWLLQFRKCSHRVKKVWIL